MVCRSMVTPKSNPICDVCRKDPFRIEEARDIFAKNKDFEYLKKSYSLDCAEIQDIYGPKFWNNMMTTNINKERKNPMTKDRIKTIVRMIKKDHGRLLDVGFGYGFVEEILENTHLDLYGIDISQIAVKRIRNKIKGNFSVGSVLRIPYTDNFFDVTLVLEVLEHIPPHDTFKAFKELRRVLMKKGILIISVPLNEGLENLCKKGMNPSGHVRTYTSEIIKAELEISGFKVKQEQFLYAFRDFYRLKKYLQKFLLRRRWHPNDIVIAAQKP